MKSSDCETLLLLLGGYSTVGVDWVRGSCPIAPWRHAGGTDSSPSFGIEIQENGLSRWHCFACQGSGDLMDLLLEIKMLQKIKEVPGYDLKQAMDMVEAEHSDISISVNVIDFEEKIEKILTAPKLVEFEQGWLASFCPVWSNPAGQSYMHSRGVTKGTAFWLDVRYDTVQQRACFPVKAWGGRCYGLHGRDVTDTNLLAYYAYAFKGERNPDVWLNEVNCNLESPIVLTEGPFDLTTIARVYPNVLASMTASISKGKLARIVDAIKIITFYDWGMGGDLAREKLTKFCLKNEIPVEHVIPTEEEGDAGAMVDTNIMKLLAPPIHFDKT